MKNYFLILISIIVIIWFFSINKLNFDQEKILEKQNSEELPKTVVTFHNHADFKVFIRGVEIDFKKEEYDVKSTFVHLHTKNSDGGSVIHIEAENVPIGFFFSTLGMNFSKDCFKFDQNYCNSQDEKLRFLVNGKENFEFENYIPRDLDRILITFGNETDDQIRKQMENVTRNACIYSGKCPERIKEIAERTVEF